MKTAAIIAEYNPFHNGHAYQINELRSRTGAEFVIALMSGDFVQRGAPAVYDKHMRTYMALSSGADLVLELPVCFATGSAEDFASCGVALLDKLGAVDILCFGSESGDLSELSRLAAVLLEESHDYTCELQKRLRQGMSFPKARSLALSQYFSMSERATASGKSTPNIKEILSSPNNILAVEYLKALKKRDSALTPVTIRRFGQAYHDGEKIHADLYASASSIRQAIKEEDLPWIRTQVPPAVSALLHHSPAANPDGGILPSPVPIFPDDLTALLNYRLLTLPHAGLLAQFADMSPELAARLEKNLLNFETFSGRISQLKTRNYTYSRISRALLHVLLDISAEQTARFKALDYAGYARVLGFCRRAEPLLAQIKRNSSIPLITKTANAHKILSEDGLALLQMEFHASHLYQSLQFSKNRKPMPNEYNHPVIVLD